MGNSVTDYNLLLLIDSNPDSILSNANFVFPRVPSHLLKVPKIKRVFTPEILKDDLLRLSLDTLGKLRKFLEKTPLVFNFPHLVSKTDRSALPPAPKAVHHQLPHP